jgi:hypothetical protein
MNDEQVLSFGSSFIIPRSSFPPSLLPQHQIHHPAAADMRSRSAAMAQDVRVATTRFCKGVGQFRQPLEGTVIDKPDSMPGPTSVLTSSAATVEKAS